MHKVIIGGTAMAIVLSLTACGNVNRTAAQWTGYTKVCVDGVTYLQFPSGVVRHSDMQGNVMPCGGNANDHN